MTEDPGLDLARTLAAGQGPFVREMELTFPANPNTVFGQALVRGLIGSRFPLTISGQHPVQCVVLDASVGDGRTLTIRAGILPLDTPGDGG